jgi:hypothetical protein
MTDPALALTLLHRMPKVFNDYMETISQLVLKKI